MFISFEGLDFSGKSTQARRLTNRLRNPAVTHEKGPCVHFLREPGGTLISERIRDVLLDKANVALTDVAELLLFSASRAQLVAEVIRPALTRGEAIVCDRFVDSTTAYQGYGRGIPADVVRAINAAATGGTMPGLTVFIDIPVDEIGRRKMRAGQVFDRMESSGAAFYERVRTGFHEIAAAEPGRFLTIDGLKTVEEIESSIWSAVGRQFGVPISQG